MEDELVREFLPEAEDVLRGVIRKALDTPEALCAAYGDIERCAAAITCPDCVLRLLAARGSSR